MRSVRLDIALEAQLSEASQITGQPASQIIREAVRERCRLLLDQRLDRRLADVLGIIESDGGRAERSGHAFTEILRRRREASEPQ